MRGYEALHQEYGPQGQSFLGLASVHTQPMLDYWLAQPHLDFTPYRKRLELRSLYGQERRADRVSTTEF
jgi:hypothetical protein